MLNWFSFLCIWQNLPMKPSGSEDFFVGKFKFISVKDVVLFRLSTTSGENFLVLSIFFSVPYIIKFLDYFKNNSFSFKWDIYKDNYSFN